MQTLIVILIVAIAAAFLIRRFIKKFKQEEACGCGCSSCPADPATWKKSLKRKNKMSRTKALSANMEDYLEAIFHISEEKQAARAKDIADRVQVNKSSVTGALKSLSDKGLVNYAPYDIITLTAKGKKRAAEIVRRHEALKDFFIKILLIDKDEAEEASCRVEHTVSKNIIDRLIQFVDFIEICPRGGKQWLKGFRRHCENGDTANRCGDYIAACLEDVKKRQRQITSTAKPPTS